MMALELETTLNNRFALDSQHTSKFYFRIIAETGSFGNNYESVDSPCGGMESFL